MLEKSKIDLVMWTKNGEATLNPVLARINQVIPNNQTNGKFIIDDASKDSTREIAVKYGWEVFKNNGAGISDGANTALSHVETEWFCSFEQDLLLVEDWWSKVSKLLNDPKVAAISGVRFATQPESLRKLQLYVYHKYVGQGKLPSWLRSRQSSSFTLGKTLDNTLWNTKILRALGGFPNIGVNAGIDTVLAYKLQNAGYKWIVDYAIKSNHIRTSIEQELQHERGYARTLKATSENLKRQGFNPQINTLGVLFRLLTSPVTGTFIALKMRNANITWLHPLIKWNYTIGVLEAN